MNSEPLLRESGGFGVYYLIRRRRRRSERVTTKVNKGGRDTDDDDDDEQTVIVATECIQNAQNAPTTSDELRVYTNARHSISLEIGSRDSECAQRSVRWRDIELIKAVAAVTASEIK